MNKRIVIGIAIMAMAATAVQAATFTTTTGGDWMTASVWNSTTTPGATVGGNDIARINGGSTVTLAGSVAQPLGNVQVGQSGNGNLILNSGAFLGMLSASTLTIGQVGVGTFTMNGGTVTGKTFTISQVAGAAGSSAAIHSGATMTLEGSATIGKFGAGSMTMDGGSISAGRLLVGDQTAAFVGTLAFTGGTITLSGSGTNGLAINTAAGSQMTMEGNAQLIMAGNQYSVINDYVTLGDLVWANGGTIAGVGDHTWANGGNYLHTAYDSGANQTTIWVNTIPEPATVGMLGLGSLIVLLVRRMRG